MILEPQDTRSQHQQPIACRALPVAEVLDFVKSRGVESVDLDRLKVTKKDLGTTI